MTGQKEQRSKGMKISRSVDPSCGPYIGELVGVAGTPDGSIWRVLQRTFFDNVREDTQGDLISDQVCSVILEEVD